MPYKIVKKGNKWLVINKETHKIKGTHDSLKKAEAQERLLRAIDHGWKPSNKK